MDVMGYVMDNCVILTPALYIIGMFLKRTPKVPDWSIPFILLCIGIGACLCMSLRDDSDMDALDAVIQGVLVTGAAVLVDQGIKQAKNRDA